MRRKRIAGSIFFAIVLLILIALRDPSVTDVREPTLSGATSTVGTYPVSRIVDGDTIHILKDDKNVSVRFIGVDTPETVDPRRPVECFGEAASAEVARLLDGKRVRIETDSSQGEYDAYGRLLAYVHIDDLFVNEHLIAEGFGYEYTYIRPYAYQRAFQLAEARAAAEKKGLWAAGVCE